MTLSDVSIRRPVFAWMLMIALIAFGGIAFTSMGISHLPDIDFPVLNVSVTWVGAEPETMETAVADVIEDTVMTVEGIRNVTSRVQEGISNTTIEFEIGRDIDVALQEVQAKISQAQRNLPTAIDPPVVSKSNPEDQPILWAALTGDRPVRELMTYARDDVSDRLTTVSGVGGVVFGGYLEPNMRLWLDSDKMKALQITVDDVIASIGMGTVLTPSGSLAAGSRETSVSISSEARTPEQFMRLPITRRGGAPIFSPIHVGDVARVEQGTEDVRRVARFNGAQTVGLGVVKQRGSNAIAVGDAVRERIEELKTLVPEGINIKTVIDTTKFIRESTDELIFTLFLSAILTSIVCYVFLGSLGSAFNVVLAIPVSLIGSFIILKLAGFTLNTFTLLALSLSIGIVVDDAIMVLENIVRYYEGGMTRVRAALVGAREITGAATASTLAILAIFLPVVFMKGIVGQFFLQFGVAMSVVVAISLLEALTFAPMRCAEFISTPKPNRFNRWVSSTLDWMVEAYGRSLRVALKHRWRVVGGTIAVFLLSLLLLPGIKKEFVPSQDRSLFMVNVHTPVGSSLQHTDEVFKKIEALLAQRREVDSYLSSVGGLEGGIVNQGTMFIVLKEKGERPIQAPFKRRPSQQEFMEWARQSFQKVAGIERIAVLDPSQEGLSSGRGFPISFSVQGPDWQKLGAYTAQLMDKMRASGLMTDLDTDFSPNMPQARVIPDPAAAARFGVSVESIASTISTMIGGMPVARYTDESGHREVVRVKAGDVQNPDDIERLNVRNNFGEMIPLSKVVRVEKRESLMSISRTNRERSTTVNANAAPGASQAEAMDFVTKAAKDILPPGYSVVTAGASQAFLESIQNLWVALFLGIFVAYMVLASQYNSFLQPLIVLLALPFSFTGAILFMRMTNTSVNVYSMIGLLLLMGIVKKNSILLVDFTNQIRREGSSLHEALLKACPLRLRPILMTSVATVAAAIPPALALGPGAETTRPMAIVVIGGVTLSTILTLYVVPCAYCLMVRFERRSQSQELAEALTEEESLRGLPAAGIHAAPFRRPTDLEV